MLFNQQLREEKWANWLVKIQEYDIEIKPLKDVKGQGLCKLIVNNDSMDGMISISVREPLVDSYWYGGIVFYLRSGQFPVPIIPKEKRTLKTKSNKCVLISHILFRRNYDGVLLRCSDKRICKYIQE